MRENEMFVPNNQVYYFSDICNNYKEDKQWLMCINEAIEETKHKSEYVFDYKYGIVRTVEDTMVQKEVIHEHVRSVEKILKNIEMFYGKEGYEIVWKLFIEKISIQEIAQNYRLSQKELGKQINEWLSSVMYC